MAKDHWLLDPPNQPSALGDHAVVPSSFITSAKEQPVVLIQVGQASSERNRDAGNRYRRCQYEVGRAGVEDARLDGTFETRSHQRQHVALPAIGKAREAEVVQEAVVNGKRQLELSSPWICPSRESTITSG